MARDLVASEASRLEGIIRTLSTRMDRRGVADDKR